MSRSNRIAVLGDSLMRQVCECCLSHDADPIVVGGRALLFTASYDGQEHGESPIRIAQPAGTEHATELQTTNTKEMAHEGR